MNALSSHIFAHSRRAATATAYSADLWHTTTHEAAKSILANGFEDRQTHRKQLFGGDVHFEGKSVWVSSTPAFDDEFIDACGMFGFDVERQAFLRITLPISAMDSAKEWLDESWTADRQYRIAAGALNAGKIEQVTPAEALRARILTMSPSGIEGLRRLAKGGRSYGEFFAKLVREVVR